jgi:GLPGLI family protein
MKKLLIILFSLAIFAPGSFAKDFKGIISYKITYSGSDDLEQMQNFLPKVMKTYFRGQFSKTEMSMGMGKTIKIKNGEDKSVTTLIDMMGQKIAVVSPWEEVEAEVAESDTKYTIDIKNETKEILGYSCRKAVISMEGGELDGEMMIAYFTDELGDNVNYFDTPEFKEIEGIMMEFEMITPQFTMHFTATDVEKKNVSEKEFQIPEDFEVKTKEEVEQLFGGGM